MANPVQGIHSVNIRIPVQFDRFFTKIDFSDQSLHKQIPKVGPSVPVDIKEDSRQFVVYFYLGDVDPANTSIVLRGEMLTISINCARMNGISDFDSTCPEKLLGFYKFSTRIPARTDVQHINAFYTNNLLKVIVPKETGRNDSVQ